MAATKRYEVKLTRTSTQTAAVMVEAGSKQEAAMRAGMAFAEAKWTEPATVSIEIDSIENETP